MELWQHAEDMLRASFTILTMAYSTTQARTRLGPMWDCYVLEALHSAVPDLVTQADYPLGAFCAWASERPTRERRDLWLALG